MPWKVLVAAFFPYPVSVSSTDLVPDGAYVLDNSRVTYRYPIRAMSGDSC